VIKLTRVNSEKKEAPVLVLIPGGPGLSSLTLRSMDILNRSFNLLYVDFPGVNDNPYGENKTFDELSDALQMELQQISGTKYVLGHSYGGFFAADILLKNKCDGIVCIATPFSQRSLAGASTNYFEHMTDNLREAEVEWEASQSDQNFAQWVSKYGELYFVKPEGRELVLNDKVSAKFFLNNQEDALNKELMLPLLKKIQAKKLFIAGAQDKLLPPLLLNEDAVNGGFKFLSVNNASHFVSFDQPEIVSGLIEDFFNNTHGRKS
jgi:pimeloyl-ACP methyl ester carboxylesterase